MGWGEVAPVIAAMFLAGVVQSVSGFGFSLLAVPLMSLAIDVRLAVVVATLVAGGTSVMHAWRERADARRDLATRLIMASFVGMPAGMLAFLTVPQRGLKIALGITVLSMTAVLLRGRSLPVQGRSGEWLLGGVSGALATSLSTNGPPLVFLLQARGHSPEEFRGTINRVFAVVNVVTIAMFLAAGRIGGESLLLTALVSPFVVAATFIGYRIRPRISADAFRGLALVLLALSGVSALITAL